MYENLKNIKEIDMKFKHCIFISILILAICLPSIAFSQAKQIREALRKTATGKIDEAKSILMTLQEAGNEDPGIILLQGVLSEDANKAVSYYYKVIKDYPKSEWADDAYWRVVQFHSIKGDTAKAKSSLEVFRAKYPASEFLSPASDVVRASFVIANTIDNNDKKKATIKKDELKAEIKKDVVPKKTDTKITAKTDVKPTKEEHAKRQSYGLQVGIFSTIEAANVESKKYKEKRLKTEILEKDIEGKKMFAVVIGNYPTKEIPAFDKKKIEETCNCNPILYIKK